MNRAAGIRKFGFRRWYERQLIEGHAYLVTCLLCLILVAACAEMLSFRSSGLQQLEMLGLLMAGTAVCVASWRRYHVLMVRAECTGEQSTCEVCKTYGRFNVLTPPPSSAPASDRRLFRIDAEDDPRMTVHCRVCGHKWLIE